MFTKKEYKNLYLFSLVILLSFIVKYNMMMLYIFDAPSIITLLIRNLLFIYFYSHFIKPLLFSKKIRQRLFILFIIFSIFFFANFWYSRYFGDYLSLSNLISGEATGTFSYYEILVKQIIRIWDIFFILDIAAAAYLGFKSISVYDFKLEEKRIYEYTSFNKRAAVGILILILFIQIFSGSVFMEEIKPTNIYQEGTSYYVSVYGIIPLYTMEAYIYLNRPEDKIEPALKKVPYYRAQEQLSSKKINADNPNIILIQVESLDEAVIDYSYQGQEITPYLNELKSKSLYFDNFYAQKVNGSFDADLSVLTSLYPVNRSYVFRDIDMSRFDSLAKLLKNRGYNTMAFHNNNKDFFNRAEAYPDLGFDKFYSEEDFEEDFYPVPEDRGLGVNDYDFFAGSQDIIKSASEEGEPFFAYLISLTSHTPFNFYPEEAAEDFEDVENELLRNYFRSINFFDKSLKNFMNELEEAGVLENTIVVIYSDHESEIQSDEYKSGREFTLWRSVKIPYHIPLIINHPELDKKTINRAGTTTDIAPTILDLLDFKSLPEQFVGNSLFLEENEPILFLHETPQIFYKNQLFIKEIDTVQKAGYLKDYENEVEITDKKIEELEEIINYMRRNFMINEGDIFKEVE
ncbi:MAG: LTA synthase family protein [Halanaerobium sp.]